MDRLEAVRRAAVAVDEARDAVWFAEQHLLRAKRELEAARAAHAKAIEEANATA